MHKAGGSPSKRPQAVRMVDALRLLGFGWYFGACLGIGLGGGIALDRWLNTKPAFLLGGLLLGTLAGFYGLFTMLMPLYRARNGRKDGPPGASE